VLSQCVRLLQRNRLHLVDFLVHVSCAVHSGERVPQVGPCAIVVRASVSAKQVSQLLDSRVRVSCAVHPGKHVPQVGLCAVAACASASALQVSRLVGFLVHITSRQGDGVLSQCVRLLQRSRCRILFISLSMFRGAIAVRTSVSAKQVSRFGSPSMFRVPFIWGSMCHKLDSVMMQHVHLFQRYAPMVRVRLSFIRGSVCHKLDRVLLQCVRLFQRSR